MLFLKNKIKIKIKNSFSRNRHGAPSGPLPIRKTRSHFVGWNKTTSGLAHLQKYKRNRASFTQLKRVLLIGNDIGPCPLSVPKQQRAWPDVVSSTLLPQAHPIWVHFSLHQCFSAAILGEFWLDFEGYWAKKLFYFIY